MAKVNRFGERDGKSFHNRADRAVAAGVFRAGLPELAVDRPPDRNG